MIGAFWIAIATVTALIGDFLIKKASDLTGKTSLSVLLVATIVYALNTFAFYFSYKQVEFSSVAVYFAIGTLIASVLIGAIFFRETITPGEWVGVGIGIVAIVVMSTYAA